MRKTYDDAFKARVAVVAMRSDLTLAQIAAKYEVHANQISQWKSHLLENAAGVFNKKPSSELLQMREENETLKKKVGELTLDVDFLKKKSKQLGLL